MKDAVSGCSGNSLLLMLLLGLDFPNSLTSEKEHIEQIQFRPCVLLCAEDH